MSDPATIGLVDDEPGMLRALRRLLRMKGFAVRTFESPEVFLAGLADAHLDCVVLDVAMPGLNGLDLQVRLKILDARLPVIFLSGQGDIPMSVRAIKAGAVNFLTKPVEQKGAACRCAGSIDGGRTRSGQEQVVSGSAGADGTADTARIGGVEAHHYRQAQQADGRRPRRR